MGVMMHQNGLEVVQMFDRARIACSMARDNYREHLVVFDEKMQERENYMKFYPTTSLRATSLPAGRSFLPSTDMHPLPISPTLLTWLT